MIRDIFKKFFAEYQIAENREHLRYVVTSTDRPNDRDGSPHKIAGNAMDFTLRWFDDYAAIGEYRRLMRYMILRWPYRAGADITPYRTIPGVSGNVHIHIDMGQTKKTGMPFFFIEDNGKFIRQISKIEEI